MMHWQNDWNTGGMGLWWLLFIGLICLVLWIVFRRVRKRAGQKNPELELKRRYAHGDIDHDTYERMLENLRK